MNKLILIMAFIAVSCGASKDKKIMATWPGKTESQMIAAWGAPSQTFDNGDKGKIVVYDRTVKNVYGQALRNKKFQFFINKDGVIEKYLIN